MSRYALEIRQADFALITLLNDGVAPVLTAKDVYFVFEIHDNNITTKMMGKREFLQTEDIKGNSPLLLALKTK